MKEQHAAALPQLEHMSIQLAQLQTQATRQLSRSA